MHTCPDCYNQCDCEFGLGHCEHNCDDPDLDDTDSMCDDDDFFNEDDDEDY